MLAERCQRRRTGNPFGDHATQLAQFAGQGAAMERMPLNLDAIAAGHALSQLAQHRVIEIVPPKPSSGLDADR